MEKAIVASNIGWAPEVLSSGNEGFLVAPKSHEAYANAILELLENDILNTTFGQNAAHKVRQVFANALIAEQSLLYYQTLIDKKK